MLVPVVLCTSARDEGLAETTHSRSQWSGAHSRRAEEGGQARELGDEVTPRKSKRSKSSAARSLAGMTSTSLCVLHVTVRDGLSSGPEELRRKRDESLHTVLVLLPLLVRQAGESLVSRRGFAFGAVVLPAVVSAEESKGGAGEAASRGFGGIFRNHDTGSMLCGMVDSFQREGRSKRMYLGGPGFGYVAPVVLDFQIGFRKTMFRGDDRPMTQDFETGFRKTMFTTGVRTA